VQDDAIWTKKGGSLSDRIYARFETSKFDQQERSFLPNGMLHDLITDDEVSRTLHKQKKKLGKLEYCDINSYALDEAKTIFAILVLTGF